jgi:DNA-binding CsgD family transcriptional regulator
LKEIKGRAEQLDARWRRQPDGDSLAPVARLTKRELEILQVLVDGASTAEAATRLKVSVSTIRSHIKSILAKPRSGLSDRGPGGATGIHYKRRPRAGCPGLLGYRVID